MTENYTALSRFADAIGFDMGNTDSRSQAELLNGFARSLDRCTHGQPENQNCYIVEDLTPGAKSWIKNIAGFLND